MHAPSPTLHPQVPTKTQVNPLNLCTRKPCCRLTRTQLRFVLLVWNEPRLHFSQRIEQILVRKRRYSTPKPYSVTHFLVIGDLENHLTLWGESAVWLTHWRCNLPFGYNAKQLAWVKLWIQWKVRTVVEVPSSYICSSTMLLLLKRFSRVLVQVFREMSCVLCGLSLSLTLTWLPLFLCLPPCLSPLNLLPCPSLSSSIPHSPLPPHFTTPTSSHSEQL